MTRWWPSVQSRFVQRDGWHLARVWPPALTLLASAIACLVNPRGLGTISYVMNLSGNPVIRSLVPEWAPPSFAERGGALFLVALLLCAVVLAVSPRRPSRFQLLTYVTFGALALSTVSRRDLVRDRDGAGAGRSPGSPV